MVDIEEAKKALNDLVNCATKDGYTGAGIVAKIICKHLEVLQIIFEAPSIIEQLFKLGQLGKEAEDRYYWGTITDSRVEKVKEFFADGKRDQSK